MRLAYPQADSAQGAIPAPAQRSQCRYLDASCSSRNQKMSQFPAAATESCSPWFGGRQATDFVRNFGRFKEATEVANTRAEANASVRTLISHPVGRAVQAAVCKTAEAGAIPAWDSISSGIGVDRHTSVFQTEIEGALPSCPSTFRDANTGAGQDFHRPGCGGSTPPSCRGLCRRPPGLQTLTVKSRFLTGENSVRFRGNPPF